MSMSLGLGANLKLSTSQKLTPQMQQAIRLLQMSSLELEQEVQAKLDSNPMLEREDEVDVLDNAESLTDLNNESFSHDSSSNSKLDSTNGNDNKNNGSDAIVGNSSSQESIADGITDTPTDSLDKLLDGSYDDSVMDTDWDNIYTSAPSSLVGGADEELMGYQGSTSATIQDHIRWQINFKKLSDIDKIIADYLIDSMDDSGFIQLDIDELYNSLSTIASFYQWEESIDKDEILTVIKVIQSCEPLGVGARSLSECLALQLAQLDKDTPYLQQAQQLLQHCEYLQSNNINALLAETGLRLSDIEPSLALIRTLNPAPGQSFIDSQPHYGVEAKNYDIPDVLVSIHHETPNEQNTASLDSSTASLSDITWEVRLNPETLPKLRINQEYANLVKRGDDSPDNTYLKENLNDAKLFIRSIQERNQNLLKVATCIVKRQEQFLLHGATAMQPLILKEVAEEVELHESTVSRLTTSKSMLTPQGLYPLKYFFSSSVSSDQGDVSSTAICAIIEELIKNEDPKKPLSDKAIMQHLENQGIEIARRTIAKYREAMNIGSSTQRKQKY